MSREKNTFFLRCGSGLIRNLIGFIFLLNGCSLPTAVRSAQTPPPVRPMLQPPPPITVPLPERSQIPSHNNSLWQTGARVFFKDQRGRRVGDSILVIVDLKDEKATLKYKTQLQAPKTVIKQGIKALAGFENQITKMLPKGGSAQSLVDLTKDQTHQADALIDRKENVKMKVAATLIKQLPNGTFVVYGHQQLVVNHERRDVYISGVLRSEDINEDNTIDYQNIAEARLSYGGQGTLTDAQQRRALERWMGALWPF